MLDPSTISKKLDQRTARSGGRRDLQTLKGVRGVPARALAELGAELWRTNRPKLPRDNGALNTLFYTAHEDGLLAIGLAAAAAPDDPLEGLDLAEEWLNGVDDMETADALGWLLYGPALIAGGEPAGLMLAEYATSERVYARRAAVMAGMAALPVPVEGPAAAPLRERVGERVVSFVPKAMSEVPLEIARAFRRDEAPHVRRALARLLRAWGEHDPDAAEAFLIEVASSGGLLKRIREEAERGVKKGRRLQRRAAEAARGPDAGGEDDAEDEA